MQSNLQNNLTNNNNDHNLAKWRSHFNWLKGDHGHRYCGLVRKLYNKSIRRTNKIRIP